MELILSNGLTWGSLLFVLVGVSGFWLLKTGKPYSNGIFNIHKLIALAAAFLMVLSLYRIGSSAVSGAGLAHDLFSISGFIVLVLFGSGALLSVGKPDHKAILYSHRIGAGLAVLGVLFIVYLKMTGRI
jgi:hypothetical protein